MRHLETISAWDGGVLFAIRIWVMKVWRVVGLILCICLDGWSVILGGSLGMLSWCYREAWDWVSFGCVGVGFIDVRSGCVARDGVGPWMRRGGYMGFGGFRLGDLLVESRADHI